MALAVAGPHPSPIPLVIVLAVSGALVVALLAVLAIDRGPGPAEVAVAYEHAWDRLDFAAVWTLSGAELRDGRGLDAFVRDKQRAYGDHPPLRHLAGAITAEQADVDPSGTRARVRTRLAVHDGAPVDNELLLERDNGRWVVVTYQLAPAAPAAGGEPG